MLIHLINQSVNTIQSSPTTSFVFMAGAIMLTENKQDKILFLLDSGASDHVTNREDIASCFRTLITPIKISVAKNETVISASKIGPIAVTSNLGVEDEIENVLYCPDVPCNLLSVIKMQQAGYSVTFGDDGVMVCCHGKPVMSGKSVNNLFTLEFKVRINLIKRSGSLQVCL